MIDYAKYENVSAKQLIRYYDSAISHIKKHEQEVKRYAELERFFSSKIASKQLKKDTIGIRKVDIFLNEIEKVENPLILHNVAKIQGNK